jgi:hypothetical protein
MTIDARQDLLSFHQFVTEQLTAGQPSLSPEEAVELWRLSKRSSQEYQEDVAATREALSELDAGEKGMPLDKFLGEFRKRHSLDRSA